MSRESLLTVIPHYGVPQGVASEFFVTNAPRPQLTGG